MPWCPNCREEYRQGFTTCSDCGAELADELPPLAENGETAERSERRTAVGRDAGEYRRPYGENRRPAPAGDALWCPACGMEYRRGFRLCSDCGVELTDAPPEVVEGEFAAADALEASDDPLASFCDAHLTTVSCWPDAKTIESRLNDGGIPVAAVAGPSGVDIYVPSELLEEAGDIVGSAQETAGGNEPDVEEAPASESPAPPAASGNGCLWCPRCRVEYWQVGAAVCSDCGGKLVKP